MPTRESILALVRSGQSYRQIGRHLGIEPGLAYLVATGLPADGGDAPGPQAANREGALPGSTQHLANPALAVPRTDDAVHAWIRERAAGDPALRAAWAQHPVAPPEPAHDTDDLVDLIGQDHARLRYLQKQLQTLPGAAAGGLPDDLRRRADALTLLRELLTAHEEAEEQVFWPLVRERLPDGGELARRGTGQEEEAARLLAAVDATEPAERASSAYDDRVSALVSALRRHLAFEEAVLGRLHDGTAERERAEHGRRFKAARPASGAAAAAEQNTAQKNPEKVARP